MKPVAGPGQKSRGRQDGRSPILRLDGIHHPYGSCFAALEASGALLDAPAEELSSRLRNRLSEVYRIPQNAIWLAGAVDDFLIQIIERFSGPIVGFPPSALAAKISAHACARETLWIARGSGRDSEIALDRALDIPPDSIAIVDSPSDPLGSLLSPADAVRMARASQVLVVDERYAEFAGFSSLLLSAEFDNIVILRSFESWAGIAHPACAWAVGSPRAIGHLGLREHILEREAVAGAIDILTSRNDADVPFRMMRDERSRLYRFLRKLSFLEPIPSWGPFVPARVHLVSRDRVVSGLAARGIRIHAPGEAGLEQVVRIGIGSRSEMDLLRTALLEMAPDLVA